MIGANVLYSVPDEYLTDDYSVEAVFTGGANKVSVALDKENYKANNGSKSYVFTLPVKSCDMEKEYNVSLVVKNSAGEKIVSTERIAVVVSNYVKSFASSQDAVKSDFGKAMQTYGYYSQNMFNENDELPTVELIDIDDVTASTVADYDADVRLYRGTKKGEISKTSLYLDSGTGIRAYLADLSADVDVDNLYMQYTVNGVAQRVKIKTTASGQYYGEISDVPANKLSKMYNIAFYEGDTQITDTAVYGAYSYIYSTLKSAAASDDAKNLAKALYKYSITTEAFLADTAEESSSLPESSDVVDESSEIIDESSEVIEDSSVADSSSEEDDDDYIFRNATIFWKGNEQMTSWDQMIEVDTAKIRENIPNTPILEVMGTPIDDTKPAKVGLVAAIGEDLIPIEDRYSNYKFELNNGHYTFLVTYEACAVLEYADAVYLKGENANLTCLYSPGWSSPSDSMTLWSGEQQLTSWDQKTSFEFANIPTAKAGDEIRIYATAIGDAPQLQLSGNDENWDWFDIKDPATDEAYDLTGKYVRIILTEETADLLTKTKRLYVTGIDVDLTKVVFIPSLISDSSSVADSSSEVIEDSGVADSSSVAEESSSLPESSSEPEVVMPDGIYLQTTSILSTYDAAEVDGNVVTITEPGTYSVYGDLTDGQIVVDVSKKKYIDGVVELELMGVTMTSSSDSPIYIKSIDGECAISAKKGTVNTISDGESYTNADGKAAAIYSCDDLKIKGKGTLIVNGNCDEGIASKNDIKLWNGTIEVTAVGDAIRAKDSVKIGDPDDTSYPNLKVKALSTNEDGIKATNDKDAGKGLVRISGGKVSVNAKYDGIKAEQALVINGGEINIYTYGGYTATKIAGDSDSAKALKAVGLFDSSDNYLSAGTIDLNGGEITINSSDDAVHCSGTLTINGSKLNIKTGDDALHSDSDIYIKDGLVEAANCYEGVEAENIYVEGGTVYVVSKDDGFNAAGGDGSADQNPGGSWNPGGRPRPGMPGSTQTGTGTESTDYMLSISGGYVVINAQGDGLDSNGNIEISGGTTIIYGTTSGGNGILDKGDGANCTLKYTGGVLFGVGTKDMFVAPDTGKYIKSTSLSATADTYVAVKDAEGNILSIIKTPKNAQALIYCNADTTVANCTVEKGGTYSGTLDAYGYGTGGELTGATTVSKTAN